MKKTIIYLVLILSIGFVLRINNISAFSMFGDEVLSVNVAGHNIKDIAQLSFNNSDSPLFHIVLHYWIKLLGTKELFLRLLSIIFGLGGILLIFFICRYLFNNSVAILASLLTSISSFIILFNRAIRWYSISYFFELLFLYIFIKAIKENKLYYWILYLFIACLAMYIRFTTILWLISASIIIFLFYRKNRAVFKNWLKFQIILSIITLIPLLKIIFYQLIKYNICFDRTAIKFGTLGKIVYIIYSFWFGQTIMPNSFVIVALGFIIFVFLMYKFILFYNNNFIPEEKRHLNILIIFFLVSILGASVSKFSAPHYIMSSSALLMVLLSLAILSYKRRLTKIVMISLVIVIQGYSLYNLYTKQQYLRREIIDSWPQMARYVYSHYEPGDAIIYDSISFGHYFKEMNPQMEKYLLKMGSNFKDLEERMLKNKYYKRLWYVNSPLSLYLSLDNNSPIVDILAKYKFSLSTKLNFDEDEDVYFKRRIVKREFSRYRNSINLFNRQLNE